MKPDLECAVLAEACRIEFPDDSPHRVLSTASRTCQDMIDRRPIRPWRLNELERLMSRTSKLCLQLTGSPGCGTTRILTPSWYR